MMDESEKSDRSVVPKNSPNRAGRPAAEAREGRERAKGNRLESDASRTQGRSDAPSALERVREVARRKRNERFTALLHHVYDVDRVRKAYLALKRDAAAGIDGETWQHYGEDLEANLQGLSARLQRGAYRAKPVRRAYIAKSDGRQRPLGVPTLEDKIVQRSVVEVLNAIYEVDFLGFSYGFRPGRSAHQALDALTVAIERGKVGWVVDADFRDFLGTLDHGWLVKFLEHRIGDRRVVRLIQKWLRAGVLEDGRRTVSAVGTVQGGSVSPLLANLYLHYVFDLWIQRWRKQCARGEVIVVRYADDLVVGFQKKDDAERFLAERKERLRKFGLELHPEKTRLLRFGRFAALNRAERGQGKPETFDFLGFTHICAKNGNGKFVVWRQTIRRRMQAKLREVKIELQRRMHQSVEAQGAWLGSVLRGHFRYYGVPFNSRALHAFRNAILRRWKRVLDRRSPKGTVPWSRFRRWTARWLPTPRICHPYPNVRFLVMTQGRSRMR
jgi:RNA-directed DNA polymerase